MNTIIFSDSLSLQEVQDELVASELRYRRLFETAKEGILILNAETGQIDDVNPFLIELLGFSRDQLIDKKVWEIGLFKDILANRDNFLQLKEKKYIRFEDLPLETVDGNEIDVEFVSSVYKVGHNDVIQCNIRDITERKRTANLLAIASERLRVTLQSIGDGVIATDANGNIQLMNYAAAKILECNEAEALGKTVASVLKVVDSATRKILENPIALALRTGEISELTVHASIVGQDDSKKLIEDSFAPIKDKTGTTAGWVLVFRDITEKQKLIDIAQTNLMLESLGTLAGGLAHDFNNLLGGIFGYMEIAKENTQDKLAFDSLTKALNTVDRAKSLTGQLLTFSKGGAPVCKVSNLEPIIREVVRFAMSGSNIICQISINRNLFPCDIDVNQISRVIENLIINAKQAMPDGGTIVVEGTNLVMSEEDIPHFKPGNYIKISISDSGTGISKENLSRIFTPFFTTKTKGHGLGLATCYSIVQRHGGLILVESEPGKGSTFTIYLPATISVVEPLAKTTKLNHSGNGTFLILDDEPVILDTLSFMLESLGYKVVCKSDGRDVIDFVIEENFANRPIVGMILDLTVPGKMGGKDAIVEIRKLIPAIPVFVASGYADDPVIANPSAYGFTDSICKPFRKAGISEMLNKYLNSAK